MLKTGFNYTQNIAMEDCDCVIFNRFCHKRCVWYPTCRQNICWLIKEWQLLTVCVAQIFCILWDCTVITYFHLPSCTFSTHSDISCSPVIAVLKVLDVCVKVRDRDKAERNWTRGNLIVATLKSFSKIVLAMLCSDEGISEHFVI